MGPAAVAERFQHPYPAAGVPLRRAICEYGYPRNDVLSRGETAAGQVRQRLGIAAGKRVILYAPTWRDKLRGFCFDFEAEAPGPLLASSPEVLAAVRDVDSVAASYASAYRGFAATYCPLDDGKAGARVCDRLFGS